MSLSTKVSGAFKTINECQVKVSGAWKKCIQVYTKVNGVWRSCDIGDSFSCTVNTQAKTSGNKKAGIPFYLYGQSGITLYVDWGDGTFSTLTSSNYTSSSSNASVHEYATAGTYNIIVASNNWANMYLFCAESGSQDDVTAAFYWSRTTITKINKAIPKVKGIKYCNWEKTIETRNNSFFRFFYNYSLQSIPSDLFSKNTAVTDFDTCFYGCRSLASLPSGLFNSNTAVTRFDSCFGACTSLTSIPSGLFDKTTKVTTFEDCFYYCTSLTSVPTGLFDKNTLVTNFSNCFSNCTSLTSIPTGLFDKNTKATIFDYCFYRCSLTSIPQKLFDKTRAAINLSYCFAYCSSLNNITVYIGSSAVTNCDTFFDKKSGATRIVYVPASSTTKTTFDNEAGYLGATIRTYTPA